MDETIVSVRLSLQTNLPKAKMTLVSTKDESEPSIQLIDRMGHSLLLDEAKNCLWIVGGQSREKDAVDLWSFDLSGNKCVRFLSTELSFKLSMISYVVCLEASDQRYCA